jgi:hypothetical protein
MEAGGGKGLKDRPRPPHPLVISELNYNTVARYAKCIQQRGERYRDKDARKVGECEPVVIRCSISGLGRQERPNSFKEGVTPRCTHVSETRSADVTRGSVHLIGPIAYPYYGGSSGTLETREHWRTPMTPIGSGANCLAWPGLRPSSPLGYNLHGRL